ncbi:type III secretion system cytoplasmic ring protein SctQ [Burkholderia metallica]|uniref:Surface presentation of antigens protein SpaO n=1 Tax=Burkholderia metallica TaxID=488729 RepID=A0ABT8PHU5_9BURK|nr:type III secretion system cytoplasmic ring protein SctQ [Burkholderia metallica]MDN7934719.1 type III secretion system cytoplasmic ring protein SctQ [Burkholderia metallica]
MRLSCIRRATRDELSARQLLAAWTRRDVTWRREPPPAGDKFAIVDAYCDTRHWSGYVDLDAWLERSAPHIAALARQGRHATAHAMRMFNACERPIEVPESLRELSYHRITARLPAEREASPSSAVAVDVPHGPLWLTALPAATPGDASSLSEWARALPVLLEFRLGTSRLRRSLLQSVQPGDVLLVAEPRHAVCVEGRVLGAFRIDEEGLHIMNTGHDQHQDLQAPLGEAAPPIDVSDLPIRIDVVLHRCAMSVSDVDAFGQGTFLPLAPDAQRRVEITSGGAVLAVGELVELDGRLGVEIHHVARGRRDG